MRRSGDKGRNFVGKFLLFLREKSLKMLNFRCMKNIHLKSKCCNSKIIRYGHRRKQCSKCKKTWTIRPKRRGRKQKRIPVSLAKNYLNNLYTSVNKLAILKGKSRYVLKRDLRKSLLRFNKTTQYPKIPFHGDLICVLDAIINKIANKKYTTYFVLIKKVDSNNFYIHKPLTLEGIEDSIGWEKSFLTIDSDIRRRIKFIVGDHHKGIIHIIKKYNISYQACHFHLIFRLLGRRSKSKYSRHRKTGINLYNTAREIITTTDNQRLKKLLIKLNRIKIKTTSKNLKRYISGFIKTHQRYRTYLNYPELKIPKTTNVVESLNSKFRELCYKARGFRTINSFKIWMESFVKNVRILKTSE